MTTVVVDISRAWPSTESKLITKAHEQHNDEATKLVVVGFDHQRPASDTPGVTARFESLGAALPPGQIVERIAALISSFQDRVVVFSFHPEVIGRQGDLSSVAFEAESLNQFTERPTTKVSWPADFVRLPEAVDLLSDALRARGHTSSERAASKTSLRDLLIAKDQRFDKSHSAAAATPGLITLLLEEATKRGLVECQGREPRVQVWLSEHAPGSARSAVPPRGREEERTRSGLFRLLLKDAEFGPFAQTRERIYDAIEHLSKEGPGMFSESELINRAMTKARTEAPEMLGPDLPRDEYPWNRLRVFVRRLLSLSPVLMDEDGTSFRPSWQTMSTPVHGLASDWRLHLESELVFQLIRLCDDICYEDIEDIAGALLGRRDSAQINEIQVSLTRLMDEGRVVIDDTTQALRVLDPS